MYVEEYGRIKSGGMYAVVMRRVWDNEHQLNWWHYFRTYEGAKDCYDSIIEAANPDEFDQEVQILFSPFDWEEVDALDRS